MANKAKHFWIEPDELARKGLDFCSLAAQGLWLKVMRLMHDSERYGHLCRDGKAVTDEQLARRCGVDVQALLPLLGELTDFDLLKRTADGILFSPELVAQAEWRSKEAKRQKDFQDKQRELKRQKSSPSTNIATNDSYNGYITPELTDDSQPNFKLLKPSSSSNEKEEGGGKARAPVREGNPPPSAAAIPENETLTDYLLRKQLEFPHFNVQKIYDEFVLLCGSEKYPKMKNSKRQFDKWLEEQDVEFEQPKTEISSQNRAEAIKNCGLCDDYGYIKIGDDVAICKHENIAQGAKIS